MHADGQAAAFHFGSETQCLQHSPCQRQIKIRQRAGRACQQLGEAQLDARDEARFGNTGADPSTSTNRLITTSDSYCTVSVTGTEFPVVLSVAVTMMLL